MSPTTKIPQLVKVRSVSTLTKAEALRIQAEQVEHYARCYGPHVRELVAAARPRTSCPMASMTS